MTIFYVSIQLGLLEFLKLMMSILMYQPALEKIIFIQAVSNNGDYGQENNSQHVTKTFLYQYPELSGSYVQNTIPCCTT